jgi:RNA polymerase sigma-70 factor (ECF subfamily)
MPDDEDRLIQLAKGGDAAACAVFYNRHHDAVYRYCVCRVADASLAQDLTCEVFVRMVENMDRFQARGRPLLAWLYTIARNLVADYYRAEARTLHLPLDEALQVPAGGEGDLVRAVDRKLEADCLAAALRHLTEEQRQVVLLKFVEDLGNAEVAQILCKSEGAVKSLQHRALSALRRALIVENCYEARR